MSSDLPVGWQAATWGDLATLEYGRALKQPKTQNGPVVVFGTNGPIGRTTVALSNDPTVIVGRKGAYRGIHWAAGPFWVIDTAFYLRPDRNLVEPRWAYYELLTHDINAMDSGSAIPSTSREDFYALPVKLPPLLEQRRIVSVLQSLDDKIESNRRLGRLAEEAVTHSCARVARIGTASTSDWSTVPFLEAVEINPRVRIAKGSETPFIAMADVPVFGTRPDTIGRRPYSGGCKYEPGDTLMARITGCIEHGKGAFIDFLDEPGAGSTEFLVFRARDPLTPEVVFCLSRDQRLRSHAIASMTGTSGRQRVDNACFEALNVSIAPETQERAAALAFMRRAMEISKIAWAEARTLSSIRDALLPRLVSGQIRVPAHEESLDAEAADLVESPA